MGNKIYLGGIELYNKDNFVSVTDFNNSDMAIAAALNDLNDAVDNLVSVTYSELVGLKASSALVPGTLYRITDYQCTTAQDDTSAATHNFDIIVTATDVNVLSENAKAIKHDGDTYFSASTLDAWELKYSLENDTDRFQWADDTNGKGVIWWMKDEWNNECWYDFKNIMFKRYKITASTVDNLIGLYSIEGATNITVDTSTTYYCYTFTMIDTNNNMPHDVSVEQDVYYFDEGYCRKTKSNIFKPFYDANYDLDPIPYLMILPNNVFVTDTDICAIEGTYGEFPGFYDNTFGDYCQHNTFGRGCYNNTFGNNCGRNTFGDGCYNNTFGYSCYKNTFGYGCARNTFGHVCYSNTFVEVFSYNTFGNDCKENTFGDDCQHNTFGNYCQRNTFGRSCSNNTFGGGCYNNTFGRGCSNNTFGNDCRDINFQKDYIYYCIIENGNQYINITSTQTTSLSMKLCNFTVSQGVNNSATVKTISHNTVNDTFKTTYQNSSSTVVNI